MHLTGGAGGSAPGFLGGWWQCCALCGAELVDPVQSPVFERDVLVTVTEDGIVHRNAERGAPICLEVVAHGS